MAGLSLGEYTALVFAGVLSFEDGIKVGGLVWRDGIEVGGEGGPSFVLQHGTCYRVWYSMVQHGTCYSVVQYGTWYSMVQHGTCHSML